VCILGEWVIKNEGLGFTYMVWEFSLLLLSLTVCFSLRSVPFFLFLSLAISRTRFEMRTRVFSNQNFTWLYLLFRSSLFHYLFSDVAGDGRLGLMGMLFGSRYLHEGGFVHLLKLINFWVSIFLNPWKQTKALKFGF